MFQNLSGRTPDYIDGDRYRRYAVVAPYMPETGEFLFQVRSRNLKRQPGEVCFPGGLIEPGELPIDAGIREAMEELLVPADNLQVIAPLDIMVTSFNTIVYPFLADLSDYHFTYNSDEVQEVFTVPFSFFLENEPEIAYSRVTTTPENPEYLYGLLGIPSYPWGSARNSVLFYHFEDKVIWGMTAKFVDNIVRLYRKNKP